MFLLTSGKAAYIHRSARSSPQRAYTEINKTTTSADVLLLVRGGESTRQCHQLLQTKHGKPRFVAVVGHHQKTQYYTKNGDNFVHCHQKEWTRKVGEAWYINSIICKYTVKSVVVVLLLKHGESTRVAPRLHQIVQTKTWLKAMCGCYFAKTCSMTLHNFYAQAFLIRCRLSIFRLNWSTQRRLKG